jgi:hypothetical protein
VKNIIKLNITKPEIVIRGRLVIIKHQRSVTRQEGHFRSGQIRSLTFEFEERIIQKGDIVKNQIHWNYSQHHSFECVETAFMATEGKVEISFFEDH